MAIAHQSLSDEAPGPALGHRLDALAMIFGPHQPILFDELEVRLRLDCLGQPAPDSCASRIHRQRRVLRDLRGLMNYSR